MPYGTSEHDARRQFPPLSTAQLKFTAREKHSQQRSGMPSLTQLVWSTLVTQESPSAWRREIQGSNQKSGCYSPHLPEFQGVERNISNPTHLGNSLPSLSLRPSCSMCHSGKSGVHGRNACSSHSPEAHAALVTGVFAFFSKNTASVPLHRTTAH